MNFSFAKDIHVVDKKWLEMVVKQTLRAVANFGHQTLGLKWLQLLHQMESLLETTNKIYLAHVIEKPIF